MSEPAGTVTPDVGPADSGAPPPVVALNRWVWAVGGAVVVVLLAFANRYGYHRDELYFLLCGRHLDWGFVDQPPLTPAVARLADLVAPDNLVVLRTPSALAAGASVLLTALICREVGGGRAAQLLAAGIAATSGVLLASGHLLSTTTFDVLCWLALILLALRILRTGDARWFLALGAIAGVGLLNKYLVGLLAVGLVAGVAIAGPRRLLRSPWLWGGLALAVLLVSPTVIWQAANGFPQLDVVGDIAAGESSFAGRPVAVGLQLVMLSPLATVFWISGLVALFRRPSWRRYRPLAWAWVVILALLLIGGGKGYYDAPLLLALAGVGAVPVVAWWGRGRAAVRGGLLAAGAVVCAVINAVLMLPTWPSTAVPDAIVAINYDAGATVGWPAFTDSVARVYRSLPPDQQRRTVLLAANYGEAGALARYGPARDLPKAYSGHMSVTDFGTPPSDRDVVIAVGYEQQSYLLRFFDGCRPAGTVDLGVEIDSEEADAPIWVCEEGLRDPWPKLWPRLRRT